MATEAGTDYDIGIIGAGPAGLAAAIEAARAGRRVVVVEAGPRPGRKLLASGGGRCNLTNTLDAGAMAERFPEHRRFVGAVLRAFGPGDLRRWFDVLGVATHAPDGYRVFPETHDASTVLDGLLAAIRTLGVELRLGWPVASLRNDGGFVLTCGDGRAVRVGRLVVACGGMGYPGLGDGGAVWRLLEELGHTVATPVPAMVPLVTRERWPGWCRADTLPKVELAVGPRWRPSWVGDLIFTRDGIAGPVVLDGSREIAAEAGRQGMVAIRLRLRGGWDGEQWRGLLGRGIAEAPTLPLAEWLSRETSPSLAGVALAELSSTGSVGLGSVGRKERNRLADWLGGIPLTVVGSKGFTQAMVTRGGVSPRELTGTLESRKVPGLYLAGEVIDVDGPCGGFNLQWAFASGWLVGRAAAALPRAGERS